jgi:hypothetical protein
MARKKAGKAGPKTGSIMLATLLLILALPLGVAAATMIMFGVMALLSSPESGGGWKSAGAFFLFGAIAAGCCVLAGMVGMRFLRG